jgi:hypothetical protein
MNNDVPSRWNLRFVPPQDLSNSAAYAIPHHRAAQSLLDANAEPADAASRTGVSSRGRVSGAGHIRRLLRAEENCELRARAALARAIYGFVFDAPQQPHGTGKILPRTVRISR